MTTMNLGQTERPGVGQGSWPDDEVAEIWLPLPAWQAAHLLHLATFQRLTLGQLLRGFVSSYLAGRGTGAWGRHPTGWDGDRVTTSN